MKSTTVIKTALCVTGVLAATSLAGCDMMTIASGQQACQRWTADRTAHNKNGEMQTTWAKSFFKSFYESGPKGRKVDLPAENDKLLADLDGYCAGHPADKVYNAATRVMLQAIQPRLGPNAPSAAEMSAAEAASAAPATSGAPASSAAPAT